MLTPKEDPKLMAIETYKNSGKSNFGLSMVLIELERFDKFYKGMSNNILWPAFHNILHKIDVKNEDFNEILKEYREVNKQFAKKIVESNPTKNDFIWIQDYHLLFVGEYLREIEVENAKKLLVKTKKYLVNNKKYLMKAKESFELGFFLHTPFNLTENFVEKFENFEEKFKNLTKEIIKGMLSFDKVGFQTNKDRDIFVKWAKHFYKKKLHKTISKNIIIIKIINITPKKGCNLGVYPATIKIDDFTSIAEKEEIINEAKKLRDEKMANTLGGGKLFFGVERFDYTKGIKEKLRAFEKYLEDHPDRVGKDVLYQIAQDNRGGIGSFKIYHDEIKEIPEEINKKFQKILEDKYGKETDYKPIIFETEGVNREELVKRYLAMDIGVVTPVMDGMNLVVKEMIVCNPDAALILSEGAGTHHQFTENKLSHNYHVVQDIEDAEVFAQVMHEAVTQPKKVAELSEYLKENGVEKWSNEFLYGKK
uniref:Trehalose-6-phosphate synthase n=2 Tax=Meloidogyne TaxID=189290 RepID=A0A914L9F1_MELIC